MHTTKELEFGDLIQQRLGSKYLRGAATAYPGNPDYIFFLKEGVLPEVLQFEYEED